MRKRTKDKRQETLPVIYEDVRLNAGFRLDILVDDMVIIEIKSVENLDKVHHKQLLTYLKLSGLKPGIIRQF